MRIVLMVLLACTLMATGPASAQSYLPEMSGGCELNLVEVTSGTLFHYVLKQKDKDTLANGQQVRDDTCLIRPVKINSMIFYSWGRTRTDDDGTIHWTVVGTAKTVTQETIVQDEWQLYNNRSDPLRDPALPAVQFVKIKPPQTQPPGGEPPGGSQ